MVTIKQMLILIGLMCCIAYSADVQATTVAVFPIEDLSNGRNGIHFEMTEKISRKLLQAKIKVLSSKSVISFMARNRIRWVGYLDSENIVKAHEELTADYIVLGTVNKTEMKGASALPVYDASIFLVRTIDARTVWSHSTGVSVDDMRKIMGLNEPKSEEALKDILVRNLLATWPAQIDKKINQAALSDIEDVALGPRYVKPGEKVTCMVRIRRSKDEQSPKIYVQAGPSVFIAMENKQGTFYEASWKGSDILIAQDDSQGQKGAEIFMDHTGNVLPSYSKVSGGGILQIAATDVMGGQYNQGLSRDFGLIPVNAPRYDTGEIVTDFSDPWDEYESDWTSAGIDGNYPVSLTLKWPDGRKKVVFLGTYFVDGSPPVISLDLKAKKIDDTTVFADRVIVTPKMADREPVSRWEIYVENENSDIILSENGKGKLPKQFVWKGQQTGGRIAKDGIYKIGLRTWDRADNLSLSVRKVQLMKEKPSLSLAADESEDGLTCTITPVTDNPIAFWRMEMRAADGSLLREVEGQEFPVGVEFSREELEKAGKIDCLLFAKDELGNLFKQKINDISLLVKKKEAAAEQIEENVTENWVEDF